MFNNINTYDGTNTIKTYGNKVLIYNRIIPEVQAWLNQLTIQPSTAYISAVITLVTQLKTTGNWQYIDRLWLFATEQQQHARVSLVNPTSAQITEVNSPSWTANSGYTGNGSSSYLNTNYNPNTQGVNFTLNNNSYGSYILTTQSFSSAADMGSYDGTNILQILSSDATNTNVNLYDCSTTNNQFVSATSSKAMFAGIRLNSTTVGVYKNGINLTPLTNTTQNSLAIPNLPIFVCAINDNGSGLNYTTRKYAMAFVGSGNINQLTFYNAIQTFATTIGFAV